MKLVNNMLWFKKKEIETTKCAYESSTGDCSLIQRLKDLQAQKKEIDAKIKSYEEKCPATLSSFIELLVKMEDCRFEMGREDRSYLQPGVRVSRIKRSFSDFCGVGRFEHVIGQVTDRDIDNIYNELKAIKHRTNFLHELQQQAAALAEEIKNIKDTLGIE